MSNNPFEREKQKRNIQKTNRTMKRNRDSRPPRKKQWDAANYEDDDLVGGYERVMPRDENDRRRKVAQMAIHQTTEETPDDNDTPSDHESDDASVRGLVVEVSSSLCRVAVEDELWLCGLRGGLSAEETGYTNVIGVGDQVMVLGDGSMGGIVTEVLPRRTRLLRPDPHYSHLHQIIAANVDQLLIVAAWRDPHFWAELVDRYMIAAERHNIQPVLCINKIDLADDVAELEEYAATYRELGCTVLMTSVVTGVGIEALRQTLSGKISVLAGMSGVGKSSLLSVAEPGFQLKTGEVSEALHEGKHTTTQSIMLPYGDNGYVIDTPGIREFGLRGLTPAELLTYYPDIEPLKCRFNNCTHVHEPDCKVRAAVEAGELAEWRYNSYVKILSSLRK